MFDPLKSSGLQIKTDLENLHRLRELIQQLTAAYIERQAALLRKVQEGGDIQTITVLADYLEQGAQLRWNNTAWEIADTGVGVPTKIVEHLYGRGFACPQSDLHRYNSDGHPGDTIGKLLSNDSVSELRDDLSRRAFRADQSRAYFEYLNELLRLYQEHSVLRDAVSYPAVLREKINFTYHFAWLYIAGLLHRLGISETLRIRIAQASLEAIAPLFG